MTTPDEPDFWENRFHAVALAVGFVAHAEGWLHDSLRVRTAVYALYETGDWPADETSFGAPSPRLAGATEGDGDTRTGTIRLRERPEPATESA